MIPIYLSPSLRLVLSQHKIEPEDYRPAYGGESAGLDLFNAGPDIEVPPLSSAAALLNQDGTLVGNESASKIFKVLVPTGVRLALPKGTVALVRERGSVSKTPLTYRAGVIDPGYTGEVWVAVLNHGPAPFVLKAGEKLPFQLIVTTALTEYSSVSLQEFEAMTTGAQRQENQIGSSDKRAL